MQPATSLQILPFINAPPIPLLESTNVGNPNSCASEGDSEKTKMSVGRTRLSWEWKTHCKGAHGHPGKSVPAVGGRPQLLPTWTPPQAARVSSRHGGQLPPGSFAEREQGRSQCLSSMMSYQLRSQLCSAWRGPHRARTPGGGEPGAVLEAAHHRHELLKFTFKPKIFLQLVSAASSTLRICCFQSYQRRRQRFAVITHTALSLAGLSQPDAAWRCLFTRQERRAHLRADGKSIPTYIQSRGQELVPDDEGQSRLYH